MESKTMRRAVRSTRAVLHGAEILEFIRNPKTRRKLVAAAESGRPPVTGISEDLKELIGKDVKLQPIRQFVGVCVRAVLEEEGFQVADTGVRVSKDPVFRTGATYERSLVEKTKKSALLLRFIESLTEEEAKEALRLLRDRKQTRS
jgi:hypothetical protein